MLKQKSSDVTQHNLRHTEKEQCSDDQAQERGGTNRWKEEVGLK